MHSKEPIDSVFYNIKDRNKHIKMAQWNWRVYRSHNDAEDT